MFQVLTKCCLKFRQIFLDIGQIDPLVESKLTLHNFFFVIIEVKSFFFLCITIASACNKYYRKHHLPLNRIAVIPHGGYRKEEKQSIIALKWLKWIAEETGERIQHK